MFILFYTALAFTIALGIILLDTAVDYLLTILMVPLLPIICVCVLIVGYTERNRIRKFNY